MNVWLVFVSGGARSRQYRGNSPYEDALTSVYRYTDRVPNGPKIRTGDRLILRSKLNVMGVARVASISSKTDETLRYRCPECRTTAIKERVHKRPRYRCDRGHEFGKRIEEPISCRAYEAKLDDFRPAQHPKPTWDDIKSFLPTPNPQLSIQRVSEELALRCLMSPSEGDDSL